MKRTAAVIIILLAVLAIGIFIQHKRTAKVSCDQNAGQFNNVGQPTLSKDDIKKQLDQFYVSCLRTDYQKGYVQGAMNGNSESEAYALLQSYWSGDKRTFRSVLAWTNRSLKHSNDNLFSWKFEIANRSPLMFWKKPYFENYTVKVVDENSATDADTDIAYALFHAGTDWNNQEYIDEAKSIINDIWDKETAEVGGKRYVIAGAWANQQDRLVINPSYFSPQAYRTFALYDGSHDWNKLIADNYELLTAASNHGAGQPMVPPNWVTINKADGSIQGYNDKPDSADYGYDAFRVLWRVGMDQLFSPNFLSWNYASSVSSFSQDWHTNQEMCALYHNQNGTYVCDKSTTSTLAAPIGLFSVTNGFDASAVIQKYYIKDGELKFPDTDFYAKSWHWFGTWLWAHS